MYFFAVFVFSILLLYKSSGWVIKYSLALSRILRVSVFAIGFVIIAVSTSLPELMVGIFSALEGRVGLSVGNVFGANLADLTLVLGTVALVGGTILIKKREDAENLLELLVVSFIIAAILFFGGYLSVLHGAILIFIFAFYSYRLYKKDHAKMCAVHKHHHTEHKQSRKVILRLVLSLGIMLVSGRLLVESSVQIADFFGLATTFVGATILSAGTTSPELMLELRAVKQKCYGLALGDLFGSLITNLTLVLGTAIVISPTSIDIINIAAVMPFLFAATIVVWYSIHNKMGITRYPAIALVSIYALFIFREALSAIF